MHRKAKKEYRHKHAEPSGGQVRQNVCAPDAHARCGKCRPPRPHHCAGCRRRRWLLGSAQCAGASCTACPASACKASLSQPFTHTEASELGACTIAISQDLMPNSTYCTLLHYGLHEGTLLSIGVSSRMRRKTDACTGKPEVWRRLKREVE